MVVFRVNFWTYMGVKNYVQIFCNLSLKYYLCDTLLQKLLFIKVQFKASTLLRIETRKG